MHRQHMLSKKVSSGPEATVAELKMSQVPLSSVTFVQGKICNNVLRIASREIARFFLANCRTVWLNKTISNWWYYCQQIVICIRKYCLRANQLTRIKDRLSVTCSSLRTNLLYIQVINFSMGVFTVCTSAVNMSDISNRR